MHCSRWVAMCVDCPAGYGGPACEDDNDECAPTPTEPYGPCGGREMEQTGPRGTCDHAVGALNKWDYSCACAPGFQKDEFKFIRGGDRIDGDGIWNNCDVDLNECSGDNPCLNGGTCVDLPGRYACNCAPGYNGTNCETDVNLCENIKFAVELLQLNHSAFCKYNCAEFAPDDFICTCGNSTVAFEFQAPSGFNATMVSADQKQKMREQVARQLGLDPEEVEDIDFQ